MFLYQNHFNIIIYFSGFQMKKKFMRLVGTLEYWNKQGYSNHPSKISEKLPSLWCYDIGGSDIGGSDIGGFFKKDIGGPDIGGQVTLEAPTLEAFSWKTTRGWGKRMHKGNNGWGLVVVLGGGGCCRAMSSTYSYANYKDQSGPQYMQLIPTSCLLFSVRLSSNR